MFCHYNIAPNQFSISEIMLIQLFFQFVGRRLHGLAIVSVCGIVVGAMGAVHWFAELFSHFLPYYTLIFILATLFVSGAARSVWATCAVLCSAWLINPQWQESTDLPKKWTLMWYNVNWQNPQPEKEIAMMKQHQPDIIALAEIHFNDARWASLRQDYPHGCEHREHSPFALAVLSKKPLHHCGVYYIRDMPYIRAVTKDFTAIYALHPPPPLNGDLAAIRQDYLLTVANHIAADPNVLVVGDLNSTPFSPIFRQFVAISGTNLHTSHYLPTWQPFALNIDHVLSHSSTLDEVKIQALPWQHSDHRPILVHWH